MKLLKIILVALCLTGVALAEGVNDHIRQLEPNGVFVDPQQYEEKRLKDKKMNIDSVAQKVRNYADRIDKKYQSTQKASAKIDIIKKEPKDSKGFFSGTMEGLMVMLGAIVAILAALIWSPIGMVWMLRN